MTLTPTPKPAGGIPIFLRESELDAHVRRIGPQPEKQVVIRKALVKFFMWCALNAGCLHFPRNFIVVCRSCGRTMRMDGSFKTFQYRAGCELEIEQVTCPECRGIVM